MNRDNYKEIMKNRLATFNEHHKAQLEFDTFSGGNRKYLKIKGQNSIGIITTKSKAIDIIDFIDSVIKENNIIYYDMDTKDIDKKRENKNND